MRPILAGVAAGLALLVAGTSATAQESGSWAGSRETTPDRVTSPSVRITARFVRNYNAAFGESADTYVTIPSGPAGCSKAGEHELDDTDTEDNADGFISESLPLTDLPVPVNCNGVYRFEVTGRVPQLIGSDEHTVTGQIVVAMPPPEVPKASGSIEGDKVELSWSAVRNAPPDFLGYRVERRNSNGAWESVAGSLDADARSFTDTSPELFVDDVIYRVRARRAAPGDAVLSDGRTVVLRGRGTTTTSTGDDPDQGDDPDGTGGSGGSDGEGSDGGGDGEGGGDGGGSGGSSGPQSRGRTGIGTAAPRLGQPSQANFPPLLAQDDDFSEEIDYGGRALGADEEDSSVLLGADEGSTGQGLAIPVGIGAVMAVWAFHLRFLARASRPGASMALAPAVGGARAARPSDRFVDPFAAPLEVRTYGAPPTAQDRFHV